MKLSFHQKLHQSTRRVPPVDLLSWRPIVAHFNYIFTDRIGANHDYIAYSSEIKVFTTFLSIFPTLLNLLVEYGGMRFQACVFWV